MEIVVPDHVIAAGVIPVEQEPALPYPVRQRLAEGDAPEAVLQPFACFHHGGNLRQVKVFVAEEHGIAGVRVHGAVGFKKHGIPVHLMDPAHAAVDIDVVVPLPAEITVLDQETPVRIADMHGVRVQRGDARVGAGRVRPDKDVPQGKMGGPFTYDDPHARAAVELQPLQRDIPAGFINIDQGAAVSRGAQDKRVAAEMRKRAVVYHAKGIFADFRHLLDDVGVLPLVGFDIGALCAVGAGCRVRLADGVEHILPGVCRNVKNEVQRVFFALDGLGAGQGAKGLFFPIPVKGQVPHLHAGAAAQGEKAAAVIVQKPRPVAVDENVLQILQLQLPRNVIRDRFKQQTRAGIGGAEGKRVVQRLGVVLVIRGSAEPRNGNGLQGRLTRVLNKEPAAADALHLQRLAQVVGFRRRFPQKRGSRGHGNGPQRQKNSDANQQYRGDRQNDHFFESLHPLTSPFPSHYIIPRLICQQKDLFLF